MEARGYLVNTEPTQPLTSLGKTLDTSAQRFGIMRRADDIAHDAAALQARIKEDGYLLLSGLLDRNEVLAARQPIVQALADEGQLEPGFPVEQAVARKGTEQYFRPDMAAQNAALKHLLYAPEGRMMRFFERFLAGPVRHFDFTWLRCVAPGKGTPPHCDIVYMGRGTPRLYTAWTPLGDVDLDMGGVMVLEGSHRNERLRNGYGRRDVDSYCVNDPNDEARTARGYNGWLSEDPVNLQRGLKGRWLTSPFAAGDVLIFDMFLVHGGLDNRSDRYRLSSDSRYQLASEPVDERWVGTDPPGHGPAGKRGKIC